MGLPLGQVIDGKYRVVRVIGEGGMGTVYEGENLRIGRKVAIKVLNADSAHAPDIRRRFEREAKVSARIGSPHVCDVLDLGDLPDGQCYLVMEYLEGEGLDVVLERGPLGPDDVTVIAYQLLEGLKAMHEVGIVHRYLKPANVFLSHSGGATLVKILDFGVSKFQEGHVDGHMTQTGAVLGTPLYMSPEQARGNREIDGRSDIYSVGVILYRALSGRLPFEGDNYPQLLFKIALEAPPPLAQVAPGLDADLGALVEHAMAKDPAARHQTAVDLQDAIVAWGRVHGRSSVAFAAAAAHPAIALSSGQIPIDGRRITQRLPPSRTPVSQRDGGTPAAWEQLSHADSYPMTAGGNVPGVAPSAPSLTARPASQPSWPKPPHAAHAAHAPSPLATSGHRISIPAPTDSGAGMPLDQTFTQKGPPKSIGTLPNMGDSASISRSYGAFVKPSPAPYFVVGAVALILVGGIGGGLGLRQLKSKSDVDAIPAATAVAPAAASSATSAATGTTPPPPEASAQARTAPPATPSEAPSASGAVATAPAVASDGIKAKPQATTARPATPPLPASQVTPTPPTTVEPPPVAAPTSTASGKPGRKIRTDI